MWLGSRASRAVATCAIPRHGEEAHGDTPWASKGFVSAEVRQETEEIYWTVNAPATTVCPFVVTVTLPLVAPCGTVT